MRSEVATKRVTASDIRASMASRWCAPEYAIMWEVADGTGAAIRRYADAVIMSLWPSRGLELHGIEIKVSRSDWKREAADPSKAETIARFCDRWWVHTPPGVVDDPSGLPPAWGLREFDGRSWRTVREAEKTAAEAPSRLFLAAMLRRADGTMREMMDEAQRAARAAAVAELSEERQRLHETIHRRVAERTDALTKRSERLDEFEAAFGGDDWRFRGGKQLGAVARNLVLHQAQWGSLTDQAKRLRDAADTLDEYARFLSEAAE